MCKVLHQHIVDSDFDHIELRGLYSKKEKKLNSYWRQAQAYSELEKNLWHIVIFELLSNLFWSYCKILTFFFLLVAKNARQSNYRTEKPLYPALVGMSRLKSSQLYVQAGPILVWCPPIFRITCMLDLHAYSFWKI